MGVLLWVRAIKDYASLIHMIRITETCKTRMLRLERLIRINGVDIDSKGGVGTPLW